MISLVISTRRPFPDQVTLISYTLQYAKSHLHSMACTGGSRGAYESAKTMRVRLAFSMVNLTLPPSPAIRPEVVSSYPHYNG